MPNVSLPEPIQDAAKRRNEFLSTGIQVMVSQQVGILSALRDEMVDLFSTEECGLILDATNGTLFQDEFSIRLIDIAIEDAVIDLARKWDVDSDALVAKMNKLSLAQKYALVDAIKCWWQAGNLEPGELLIGHPDDQVKRSLK